MHPPLSFKPRVLELRDGDKIAVFAFGHLIVRFGALWLRSKTRAHLLTSALKKWGRKRNPLGSPAGSSMFAFLRRQGFWGLGSLPTQSSAIWDVRRGPNDRLCPWFDVEPDVFKYYREIFSAYDRVQSIVSRLPRIITSFSICSLRSSEDSEIEKIFPLL